ncbi:RAxF-45 family protein [Halobacillus litoralis]|nr:RAxF-45 family protein [Halobacillus litoralis]WLR48189.1 RAxF-45 family protein [Halobacillus litoralis]
MLQMHVLDYQINYLRRAIIHDSAVNGIRMSKMASE